MYKLFVQPQISPMYVTVNGPNGPEQDLNHEGELILPPTIVYQPTPWDVYSANPADRTLLYAVTEGGNTDEEIFAACPGLRLWKEKKIRASCEVENRSLISVYQEGERRTWAQQRDEATRWKNGGFQDTPFVDKIAAAAGDPREEILQAIVDRVLPFDDAAAANLGKQRIKLKAIYAANTVQGVLDVVW